MNRTKSGSGASDAARYLAHVQRITPDQARLIVDSGRGMGVRELAQHLRGRLDFSWDHEADETVGALLYATALEMLDEYDARFRPVPAVRDMGDVLHGAGRVVYHTASHEFEVIVGERRERFGALHDPVQGMDFEDISRARAVADRLRHEPGS